MGHIRVELCLSCSMVGVVVKDAERPERRLKNRGTVSRAPSHATGCSVSSRIQSHRLASPGLVSQLNGIFHGSGGRRVAIGIVLWRVFERKGSYAKGTLTSSHRSTRWSQEASYRCSDSETREVVVVCQLLSMFRAEYDTGPFSTYAITHDSKMTTSRE